LSVLRAILKSRAKWRKSIKTGLERFDGYLKVCPDGGGIRAKWRKSINTGLERFEGYFKIKGKMA
jgi:hypothetical protein